MDAKQPNLKKGDSLPNEDNVYRLVHKNKRAAKNNMEPKPDAFKLSPLDENKLSVDYEKLTTPEESLARFGATYKHQKEEFKNPKEFNIYSLNIGFVKAISSVKDVYYDPVLVAPPQKGKPSNVAHSSIEFDVIKPEDEPEILSKLQEHAKAREVSVKMSQVNSLTEKYRTQWD